MLLATVILIGILYTVFPTSSLDTTHELGIFHLGSFGANENNGSTDLSLHKGDQSHKTSSNQYQEVLNTLSCVSVSCGQRTVSDTCQLPLSFGRMGSVEPASHFKKIQHFKVDYTEAKVTQYESQRTGMRVSVVDRKGPKVCCFSQESGLR
jgi:hypothetical protein